MQSGRSRPLLFFYILVAYVLLQFAWWSYLMIEQNNEIYRLKTQINLFQHHDPQLIIEKGNELEKKLHGRWMMIAGEGLVFLILLSVAFLRVQKTFKREADLSHQQKNFMHSITHELKSPIASVKLGLETLLKRDLEKEKQKEILSNALSDTERLNNLVDNILLSAQIENRSYNIQKEKINLSEFIHSLLTKIHQTNNSHSITQSVQPGIFAELDKISFTSIFLNLVENAMKYSPDGSMIKIILAKKENSVTLSVCDEGAGVSDEEKQNIFTKFYRVGNEETRKTKGTGLGLYIVKYLTEKNGGTVSVKNNSPRGTIFEIAFHG